MSTSATFTMTIICQGDSPSVKTLPNAAGVSSPEVNSTSPAQDDFINLASGDNTITAPVSATPIRLTVILPSGNTQLVKLKGVTGDTGTPLAKVGVSSFGIDTSFVTGILNAAGIINGVRVIWT